MRACPPLDLAYRRTTVRPAAHVEAPRGLPAALQLSVDIASAQYPHYPPGQYCLHCTSTMYLTLVTPWWVLLTIVINGQESGRDTEPERSTLSGRLFPLNNGLSTTVPRSFCFVVLHSKQIQLGGVPRASPLELEERTGYWALQDLLTQSRFPGVESLARFLHLQTQENHQSKKSPPSYNNSHRYRRFTPLPMAGPRLWDQAASSQDGGPIPPHLTLALTRGPRR